MFYNMCRKKYYEIEQFELFNCVNITVRILHIVIKDKSTEYKNYNGKQY